MFTSKVLFLGDSYTIGEGVMSESSFPNIFLNIVKSAFNCELESDILAQTGWQSKELLITIDTIEEDNKYDFVIILIGVNDAYDGIELEAFDRNLQQILAKVKKLINASGSILLLNFPNYGYSPRFISVKKEIERKIESFLYSIRNSAKLHNVLFFDIERLSRVSDVKFYSSDGLHPSGLLYTRWAEALFIFLKHRFY